MSPQSGPLARRSCDLFCRVVDNLGDVGVCWRLARQLAREHGFAVRLVVDDLGTLHFIAPEVDAARARQSLDGVEIVHWTPDLAIEPVGLVIEAFACEPPAHYVEAMARREPRPVWINLEYLATERWALELDGLPSPHPRLPLAKTFVFPGFDGPLAILREADLDQRRRASLGDPAWRATRLGALGADPRAPFTLFVFTYATSALEPCLRAFVARGAQCLLAPTPANRALIDRAEPSLRERLVLLEPVAQQAFDEWLWLADAAIVRGEDSFVRAQLAGKPLVWQPYVQDADAHHDKLAAFASLYRSEAPPSVGNAWWAMQDAWNRGQADAGAWDAIVGAWLEQRLPLQVLAEAWRARLAARVDLATRLASALGAAL